ncbi:MAG: C25 family cysteine peptidase [Candidatus Zixiibacteriota bacterium]
MRNLRAIFGMLAAILLSVASASAEQAATIQWQQSLLSWDATTLHAEYDDYDPMAIGERTILPSRTYYIELFAGEYPEMITADADTATMVRSGAGIDPWAYLATSDSIPYHTFIESPSTLLRLGSAPVVVDEVVEIEDNRYARVLLFPVIIDGESNMTSIASLRLRIGTRPVDSIDLLTRTDFDLLRQSANPSLSAGSPSVSTVEYLILTSAALSQSFQRLADYKSATGYSAEVVLIEDIVGSSSGRDDAEKLREYFKLFYQSGGKYVLLGGDETVLPLRYTYHYATEPPVAPERLQVCDLYFADLTGHWDVDNDGVWGERIEDQADFTPELLVGRLPFNTAEEVSRYTDKLIAYETNPGNGNREYLQRAFFYSSDQMRDYSRGGQHGRIARAYPGYFDIDTTLGVESQAGNDANPVNITADITIDSLSSGYGIVNIIAHGSNDAFVVRTSGYNLWPKSLFQTDPPGAGHGDDDSLVRNNRVGLYYSLACDNGGFDFDQPPFEYMDPNLVQSLLSLDSAGAIAFVAYSRWGWVGSSHLLQKAFFDSLFAHPERPAVEAMSASKSVYYFYRDLVMGQNYYGDPTLRIYTRVPDSLDISLQISADGISVYVTTGGHPADGCQLTVSGPDGVYERLTCDADGHALVTAVMDYDKTYTIAAARPGATVTLQEFSPAIVTAVDSEDELLPSTTALGQNYPNPFNPSTIIAFDLPKRTAVTLTVYNVMGQQVASLVDNIMPAGRHTVKWDATTESGSHAASGVYLYRLQADQSSQVRKMILLR